MARRLAELRPDDHVALVDAQRVGYGSSGRNSGFIVDSSHWVERLGVEGNQRNLRLHRSGLLQLRELVGEHHIECDWNDAGRFHVAVGSVGERCLETFVGGLRATGERFESLSAEVLRDRIGTSHYSAGVYTPGTVLVNPAALARGLASHLPANVTLFEESPVRAVHLGEPHRVECEGGSLSAKRLFLATNGFLPFMGFFARRIVPLFTFASLTRPLDESERRHAGPGEWGLVPEEAMGSTVRRTRDHRILMRNTIGYFPNLQLVDTVWERARRVHRNAIDVRFPDLGGVEIEHTWGGALGNTMNNGQLFGEIEPGVFVSAAYNGVGVALGTASGRAIADRALGNRTDDVADLEALDPPAWFPPHPFAWIGVQATLSWRRWHARSEL